MSATFPDHVMELDTGDQLWNFLKLSTFDFTAFTSSKFYGKLGGLVGKAQ